MLGLESGDFLADGDRVSGLGECAQLSTFASSSATGSKSR